MNSLLVTCYANPDTDGVAGAIAYGEFLEKTGKKVTVGLLGEPHEEAQYVLNRFGFECPPQIANADDFDDVVLVDASDLNGLEGKIAPEKVIEIIDHRKIHEADKFPRAKAQIELVGAAATLVAEKFMAGNTDISKKSAILLYAAIISNTLNFKATHTTERDRKAASWLNTVGKLSENFVEELFLAKSDLSGEKLHDRIVGDFASFEFGKKKIGIGQIEMIGAEKLVNERLGDILTELGNLTEEKGLDMIFLSVIELKDSFNLFVTDNAETQSLLAKVLGVTFKNNTARREGLIMRKQITPLLKEALS